MLHQEVIIGVSMSGDTILIQMDLTVPTLTPGHPMQFLSKSQHASIELLG